LSSIDALLDALFEMLIAPDGKPALDPHMSLQPDPRAQSYFIPAPRPALTFEEMRRPDRDEAMAEVARVLADLPSERREALVAGLKAAYDALAAEAAEGGPAEPPTLIYALH
jgi:hypothetical protein